MPLIYPPGTPRPDDDPYRIVLRIAEHALRLNDKLIKKKAGPKTPRRNRNVNIPRTRRKADRPV